VFEDVLNSFFKLVWALPLTPTKLRKSPGEQRRRTVPVKEMTKEMKSAWAIASWVLSKSPFAKFLDTNVAVTVGRKESRPKAN
jgi:hypothetical protein